MRGHGGYGLRGFYPTSVSFPTPYVGYLLGFTKTDGWDHYRFGSHHVLARTTDGGLTWRREPAPPVNAVGYDYSPQVFFATADVGFIYAARLWATRDGGRHWHRMHTPGRVLDMETAVGRVWRLAHPCRGCRRVRLYSADSSAPRFEKVRGAPRFRHGGVQFVHGSGAEIYVRNDPKDHRGRIMRSYRGRTWTRQRSPCRSFGAVAAWSEAGLAAVCNVELYGAGGESKQAYVSFDGAHTWTRQGPPSNFGYIAELAAGSSEDWVLTEERTAYEVTNDEGRTWGGGGHEPAILSNGAWQVEFVAPTHVVVLANGGTNRLYLYSTDAGRTWGAHRFPHWRTRQAAAGS